jgi:hypothetical protein
LAPLQGTSEDSGHVTVSVGAISDDSDDDIDDHEAALFEARQAVAEAIFNFMIVHPAAPADHFEDSSDNDGGIVFRDDGRIEELPTSSDDAAQAAPANASEEGATSDDVPDIENVTTTESELNDEGPGSHDVAFLDDSESSDSSADRTLIANTPTHFNESGDKNESTTTTTSSSVEDEANQAFLASYNPGEDWQNITVSENPDGYFEPGSRVETRRRRGVTKTMKRREEEIRSISSTSTSEARYPTAGFPQKSGRSFRKRLNLSKDEPKTKAKFVRYCDPNDENCFVRSRRRLPLPFCGLSRKANTAIIGKFPSLFLEFLT